MSEWWAVEWHSKNRLDGDRRYVCFEPGRPGWPQLFKTRSECRTYIEQVYGYMRQRPDLRQEPHGWRLPQAVRVTVNPSA